MVDNSISSRLTFIDSAKILVTFEAICLTQDKRSFSHKK